MKDEDRDRFLKALERMSGADPARDGLQELITKHGRDAIAKATSELLPAQGDMTDAELAGLIASATETGAGGAGGQSGGAATGAPSDDKPQWAKDLEAKVDRLLAKPADGEPPVPTDELELVKQGVPVETIEQWRPLLRSTDEQAKRTAFATLAKQADPARVALLAKEKGSSKVPGDQDQVNALKARLAKADGEQPLKTPAEQLLEVLRSGAQG